MISTLTKNSENMAMGLKSRVAKRPQERSYLVLSPPFWWFQIILNHNLTPDVNTMILFLNKSPMFPSDQMFFFKQHVFFAPFFVPYKLTLPPKKNNVPPPFKAAPLNFPTVCWTPGETFRFSDQTTYWSEITLI